MGSLRARVDAAVAESVRLAKEVKSRSSRIPLRCGWSRTPKTASSSYCLSFFDLPLEGYMSSIVYRRQSLTHDNQSLQSINQSLTYLLPFSR